MSQWCRYLCLIAIASASVAAADIPRQEAEALWLKASKLQALNLRGIHSIEGRYALKMREFPGSPFFDFDVAFAFEGGMLFNTRTYEGKSYQLVNATSETGERHTREHASLGGKHGELRTRLGNGEVRVGQKGEASLLSCQLPHSVARLDFLYSLHTADPKPALVRAERLSDGNLLFELKSQRSGAKYLLTCRPEQAFMPVHFDIWVQEAGMERHFQTIEIVNTGFPGPDGSTWYYPTSGRRISYDQPAGAVTREWVVDVASVSVNRNIPDDRFILKPRPDEKLVREGDLKVLEPARTRGQSPTPTSGTEPTRNDEGGDLPPRHTQVVYGGGRGWWPWAGLGLGALLLIAGVGVWARGKVG